MITWLRRVLWRALLTADYKNPATPPPGPLLDPFQVGERLPWKGVTFKVGKIIGGEFPMIILVPVDRTHGAKLQTLRSLRDAGRQQIAETRATKKSLAAATR